jgi:hypothetical protein
VDLVESWRREIGCGKLRLQTFFKRLTSRSLSNLLEYSKAFRRGGNNACLRNDEPMATTLA